MPLYEYQCRQCGSQFELLIRGGEAPECPQCQSGELDKALSVPAAPVTSAGALPVCGTPAPAPGGCGAPWCGTGRCGL